MDTSDATRNLAGEYLVFRLGTKNYGLDILLTSEIRSYEQPSPIAQMPAFHKGLLNLRGVVVPIIDLRIVAGCEAHFDVQTVVAVVSLAGRRIGVVVDAVSDVREITADQIRQVAGSPHPDTHLHVVAGWYRRGTAGPDGHRGPDGEPPSHHRGGEVTSASSKPDG